MERICMREHPKILDLSRTEATATGLQEKRIDCAAEDKDLILYSMLMSRPARTMVFTNSIQCVKRLHTLLRLLECQTIVLHANMNQKQRLKSLERFAQSQQCVLLTTDVAARGIDIPNVQHVIHYEVPRVSETYVHRSGRTARIGRTGLTLLLVSPEELLNFKKICRTLNKKEEELPELPLDTEHMSALKERVTLAHKIEKNEYFQNRKSQHDSWFRQAAEAMEIQLDDDMLMGN
ncbi:hypothetical protein DNTS_015383 [Danionella cerebrum]|uniref:Helicase C-terminal domain-containing protein n=1 Tax=Danionella cerebrum TaxID=2873325 RepID=A0A553NWD8_9TELE|nr:hypothetical protein DNTS_015383 [Danionella translucida]